MDSQTHSAYRESLMLFVSVVGTVGVVAAMISFVVARQDQPIAVNSEDVLGVVAECEINQDSNVAGCSDSDEILVFVSPSRSEAQNKAHQNAISELSEQANFTPTYTNNVASFVDRMSDDRYEAVLLLDVTEEDLKNELLSRALGTWLGKGNGMLTISRIPDTSETDQFEGFVSLLSEDGFVPWQTQQGESRIWQLELRESSQPYGAASYRAHIHDGAQWVLGRID